jgi:hypothetical protein
MRCPLRARRPAVGGGGGPRLHVLQRLGQHFRGQRQDHSVDPPASLAVVRAAGLKPSCVSASSGVMGPNLQCCLLYRRLHPAHNRWFRLLQGGTETKPGRFTPGLSAVVPQPSAAPSRRPAPARWSCGSSASAGPVRLGAPGVLRSAPPGISWPGCPFRTRTGPRW